jgi:putative toxin-antitoxin system antitoxin component (TIGR02293 family)
VIGLKSTTQQAPGRKARPKAVSITNVTYSPSKGIDDFVMNVHAADPMRLIETERKGVAGIFVKDLSRRMDIPAQRMFDILGVPKATAEKKVAAGELLTGNGGRAALGLARLLGIARDIVDNSTAPEAKGFDSARWLGQWLETSQPALGGRKPAEFIDTPTGLAVVTKLLGAIESGAYQ